MILLPYGHERQTVQRLPWITFGLIAINVLVYIFTFYSGPNEEALNSALEEMSEYYVAHPYLTVPDELEEILEGYLGINLAVMSETVPPPDDYTLRTEQAEMDRLSALVIDLLDEGTYQRYGFIPARPNMVSLFTCMFIHAGLLHLIGNMLFLYLAGCNIEDLWGRPLYIGFYLISGIVATLVHAAKFPESTAPLVGASGAIAGLMGAFLFRLYDTKIKFFYMIFWWVRGTFKAPAYIMLPLWFLEQLWYASLSDESIGTAFLAHIGGFVFGFGFAFGMKYFKIEEKYIAPAIEKKTTLSQSPQFIQAMELSESGDTIGALVLLQRIIREEPTNLDAYMELRRMAEIKMDYSSYSKYSGSIFEILIRSKDYEFLFELYEQFQLSACKSPLPVKTLFALAGVYEELGNYKVSAEHYEKITEVYPDDLLALKSYSKLVRLYFEKLNDHDRGIVSFWKSFNHKLATDQWRSALELDLKRYSIPPLPQVSVAAAAAAIPSNPVKPVESVPQRKQEAPPIEAPARAAVSPQKFSSLVPPVPDSVPAPARLTPKTESPGVGLPHESFDLAAASMNVTMLKLALKGIVLQNDKGSVGMLPFRNIRAIFTGRVRIIDPSNPRLDKQVLFLDLVPTSGGGASSYRIQAHEIPFNVMFPRVEQSFSEAFQNLVGILANNSGAQCFPDKDQCIGPVYATFANLSRFDTYLKEKLETLPKR